MANRKAFADIHALLVQFPELHNQTNWEAPADENSSCGTTRCLAGWATWWKAHKMGLLTQKRQVTDRDIRFAVARELRLEFADHAIIGAAVLGLSEDEATAIFHDFDRVRVVARVKSYAETGKDLDGNDDLWDR